MIKVNGKVLEIGDTAVFRCGIKDIVESIYKKKIVTDLSYDVYKFKTFINGFSWLDDGGQDERYSQPLDIIDIIKAEPKIVKSNFRFAYSKRDLIFSVEADLTNRKILSVEVVE